MVNILSFKDFSSIEDVRMTMDTAEETSITVKLPNGYFYKFEQYENGLYHFGTDLLKNSDKFNKTLKNYIVVQTVKENKEYFTTNKIKGADASRDYFDFLFSETSTLI